MTKPYPNPPTPRAASDRAATLLGALFLGCGLLLLGITAYAGLSANRTERALETARLLNALDQSIATALDQQRSVAWWDAAVEHTGSHLDLRFVTDEFGAFLTETYGHKAVLLLDAADRPVFGFEAGGGMAAERLAGLYAAVGPVVERARGQPAASLRPRPDMFSDRLDGYGTHLDLHGSAVWDGAILDIDGAPAVVSVLSVSPNQNAGLLDGPPSLIVSVVPIDDKRLARFGRYLLLGDLRRSREPAVGTQGMSIPFTADDGQPLGHLTWKPAEPGGVVLHTVLPAMTIFVLALGLFSILLLRRLKGASRRLVLQAEAARAETLRDPLSGLPNRLAFSLAAERMLDHAARRGAGQVVIGYLDIDRFKDVNDTLGHQAGDALIRALGERLSRRAATGDVVARIGGDEFAMVRYVDGGQAPPPFERIVAEALAAPVPLGARQIAATASLGLVSTDQGDGDLDALMRHADIALYEAKRTGRDRAVWFTGAMGRAFDERRAIESLLKGAAERGEFHLVYQPLLDLRSGRVASAEALLRWTSPEHGAVAPSVFVPIAEEAGLMPAIGRWVLGEAIAQAGRWPDLGIAVNLSPVQCGDRAIVGEILGLCAANGVEPRRIVLEITEGVLLEAGPDTLDVLTRLSDAGFPIALDDFGTGYSSLAYLTNFRFDKIKIDRCFVQDIPDKPAARAIVEAVVAMGRGLGMTIVAEGVETEAELATIRALGCDRAQGYLVSRPLPAAEFIAFQVAYARPPANALRAAAS